MKHRKNVMKRELAPEHRKNVVELEIALEMCDKLWNLPYTDRFTEENFKRQYYATRNAIIALALVEE